MASQYERMEDGSYAFVHSTFAQRKAARAANPTRKYEFRVVAGWPFMGEVVGTFSSRPEAETFAYEQHGPLFGNSSAKKALFEKHHKTRCVPSAIDFHIERV